MKANLVKIAPPTEEKMESVEKLKIEKCVMHSYKGDGIQIEPETVTIEHDQWGRVEGVEKVNYSWAKDGAIYQLNWGWREVKPKRWVPVPIKMGWNDRQIEIPEVGVEAKYYLLPHNHRWKTVEIEREVEG